jgi:uncharacterized protein YecT (DUF1311 family)
MIRARGTSLAAAAVAAFVIAGGADMMRPGLTPESGLAGVWRVVGAKPAPWSKPRKLTKHDAPLLEYAVKFTDHAVLGPAPLSCAAAEYSSGVSYQNDLFGGRLANDDSGAMTKAVNLSRGSPTTFRVFCNGKARDYYIDDDANLITAEGNVIYTLVRPDGMDTAKVEPDYSGPSFDCTQAKTAGEQIICADAAISKADREMAAAYARLKRTESPESFATVQASQRAWLTYVNHACGANRSMPEDRGEKNNITGCLTDNYTDRADRLTAAEVVKSGALVLEPRMRILARNRPWTEESDIYPWLRGGPQAAAFNGWIAKALKLDKHRMDDKDLFPFGDDVADMKLYAHRTYSAVLFDAKITSLQIATFDYTGGAHEAINETSLNWDMRKQKPIGLPDVFKNGDGWKRFAIDYCLKDLKAQNADNPDRENIAIVVRDGGNWLFGDTNAIVHFTVYTVASFAGGEYDVKIPYRVLKPYMRPDAPML